MTLSCPAGHPAVLLTGAEVYPHQPVLASKLFWACLPCRAWVGCHDGTTTPKGTLATDEVRRARVLAHRAFDPLWKSGLMPRKTAYRWLSERLGIPEAHIGHMDVATCRRVVLEYLSFEVRRRGSSPELVEEVQP